MIHNPHGSAPGIDLTVHQDGASSRVFAFPGVPAELKEMWQASVAPLLSQCVGGDRRFILHRRIKCFGVGESDLEQLLPDLIRRGREPSVGITVHRATITLRITAHGSSPDACQAILAPTERTIHACLGDLVFGQEDDELQHAVDRLLRSSQRTLATAEWCTEGVIARWMRQLPDDQSYYRGGLVVTGDDGLTSALGITDETIVQHGRVSREVTGQMATQVRQQFHTDYGLAISAFPEKDGPQRFYVGLASHDALLVKHCQHGGHPDIWVERAAKQALDVLA